MSVFDFPQGTHELFVQENSLFDTIDHSEENATSAPVWSKKGIVP